MYWEQLRLKSSLGQEGKTEGTYCSQRHGLRDHLVQSEVHRSDTTQTLVTRILGSDFTLLLSLLGESEVAAVQFS